MTTYPNTRRKTLCVGAAALLLPAAFAARASNWPNRPTKLVVPGQACSGMDIFARMLQIPLQTALPIQPVPRTVPQPPSKPMAHPHHAHQSDRVQGGVKVLAGATAAYLSRKRHCARPVQHRRG